MPKQSDIYVISDTHFYHENIIKYCNRPFSTVKSMNDFILDSWIDTVKPGDIDYHLGDVVMGNANYDIIKKLNGRKRLVVGNHDDIMKVGKYFQKVMLWRMFPEWNLVLTHIPIDLSDKTETRKYNYNVHGHIHDKTSPTNKHFNVSVEKINYKPIPLESIYSQYAKTN